MLILYRTGNMRSAIFLSFVASSSLLPCGLQSTQPLRPCYISPHEVYNFYVQAGFQKVCPWWVPHLLTNEHRTECLAAALIFLTNYHNNLPILTCIVTSDKMRIHYITPSTKKTNNGMETGRWTNSKKSETGEIAEAYAYHFLDNQGVIYTEYPHVDRKEGQTVIKERYTEIL